MHIPIIVSAPWVSFPEMDEKSGQYGSFSEPSADDGVDIFHLIAQCPPLDTNSAYCNFLQSTHFRHTSLIARYQGEISGFVSGYLKPEDPKTFFVWQVAVSPSHRTKGLAYQMLRSLLSRQGMQGVEAIETTITEDNKASWALFKKIDVQHGERGCISIFLDRETHFKGKHETEYLYRIPLKAAIK
ncbi:diaminobutyrate acetyltransferase [Vibrio azureus]|uniref:L-2,4-diaminobutyric acid acetyltransferase n=1 Tax=Vibrio azureus NBRC 104587 TaxID=1219077 RepID=U3AS79_9VIBR|nr:diaminobutyrate acetyltransferase [Vibrio azureus]AUI88007.1 diaminobutyrate acetyltransferase [Vibrio azureus]GAD76112.1 L-2,4-diaminobutyric acid acetyltransferase [Vibrio azureus NBRC 104587]